MTSALILRKEHQLEPRLVAGKPLGYFLSGQTDPTTGSAKKLSAHSVAIKAMLGRLEKLVVPEHTATITRLLRELDDFRVRASLVGQVKAGKTMLTNALIGMPGMLPTDVNPWTSVVTSVHINTPKPQGSTAIFSFYTHKEWANLTETGGHLGELALRSGFEEELQEMRRQVQKMQRRTEDRLGPKFNLLLDAKHSFNSFNSAVIDRYVCLGEDDAPALGSGRYADVTRLAELYIDDASFGVPTTISDTPGVNDPFLARERATLETLGETDVCIIVLSAHQSFSTVDLALMRILLAMRTDRVILFVNRIDELEAPDAQIREIDDFIRGILREKGIEDTIPIVYGSSAWAEEARQEVLDTTPQINPDVLESLARHRLDRAAKAQLTENLQPGQQPFSVDKVRDLSGLHELKALVSHRAVAGIAAPFMAETLLRAIDVATQSTRLLEHLQEHGAPVKKGIDISLVVDHLDNTFASLDQDCTQATQQITDEMLLKMSGAYRDFIKTESGRIRDHVKQGLRMSDWVPDPTMLRMSLNSAYHAFTTESCNKMASIFAAAAQEVSSIYRDVLKDSGDLFATRPPRVEEPKVPASLMKTMTIDMSASWMSNFLVRATGPDRVIARFTDIVTADMVSFTAEMRDHHVYEFMKQARQTLFGFLHDHVITLQNLSLLRGDKKDRVAGNPPTLEIDVSQRLVSMKGLKVELEAMLKAMRVEFKLGVER